jgi:predicted nucleic acid-binding protein
VRCLVDTSVFIASETGRWIDESKIPEEIAVSVVTLAELHVGVLAAPDLETRSRRMGTLDTAAALDHIGVSEAAARMWALLRLNLREAGRKVNVNDLWIAATAASSGMPVVTQDSDFGPLEGIGGLQIIRV